MRDPLPRYRLFADHTAEPLSRPEHRVRNRFYAPLWPIFQFYDLQPSNGSRWFPWSSLWEAFETLSVSRTLSYKNWVIPGTIMKIYYREKIFRNFRIFRPVKLALSLFVTPWKTKSDTGHGSESVNEARFTQEQTSWWTYQPRPLLNFLAIPPLRRK